MSGSLHAFCSSLSFILFSLILQILTVKAQSGVDCEFPPLIESVVTNPSCGGENGIVHIEVFSGTQPYTYLWSTGNDGSTINNLTAGEYSVTVTDANGCTAFASFLLDESDLNLNLEATNASCGLSNGSIDVFIGGGTAPYLFAWSNGLTGEHIENLSPGVYGLTVIDDNGCTGVEQIEIEQSGSLVIESSVIQPTCGGSDGTIHIEPVGNTGPFTYQWSNGTEGATAHNLGVGSYSVTVTNAAGCSTAASFELESTGNLGITMAVGYATCGLSNGWIVVNVEVGAPPITYAWNNGATTHELSNLAPGIYIVTVSDASGCSGVVDALVENMGLVVEGAVTQPTCGNENGSIHIEIGGGTEPFTYAWSSGSTGSTVTNLAPGEYNVSVIDAGGCTGNTSFVLEAGNLQIFATHNNAGCSTANGSIDIAIEGGTEPFIFSWSNGATTQDIEGLEEGVYVVTVVDASGCSGVEEIHVEQTNELVIEAAVIHPSCAGENGSIHVVADGGGGSYTYAWSNGSTNAIVENLSAGEYAVTVTGANGCTASHVYNLESNIGLELNRVVTDASCGMSNGSINVSVEGGTEPYTYAWNNGATTQDIEELAIGIYILTVTDANGCSGVTDAAIEQANGLVVEAAVTHPGCNSENGSIHLVVAGGTEPYTYTWSTGNDGPNLNELAAGSYFVTVTDANGCSYTHAFELHNESNIAIGVQIINASCGNANGSIDIHPEGGNEPFTYAWNNGSDDQDINNLEPGVYVVTVTDADGCSSVAEAHVEASGLHLEALVSFPGCETENGSITVAISGGTEPYTFDWSNGSEEPVLENLEPGEYHVTVVDANGCSVTETFFLESIDPMEILATISGVSGGDNGAIHITVEGGTPPFTFAWDNGSDNQNIEGLEPGAYSITVTDANGCSITQEFTVIILGVANIGITDGVTIYPNPVIDVAAIKINDLVNGTVRLKIINTLGQAVYHASVTTDQVLQIDLSIYSPGAYTVEITGNATHYIGRLIKK